MMPQKHKHDATLKLSSLGWCVLLFTLVVIALAPADQSLAIMQQGNNENRNKKIDKKLGEKLIRGVTTQANNDLMTSIMQLMIESARQLEIDFNPGPKTQEIQQQVITKLDEAIEQAKSQRRKKSPNQKPSSSDRRTQSPSEKSKGDPKKTDSENPQNGQASSTTTPPSGGVTEGGATGGLLEESRRSWGHLPQRQRDEVIQGAGEKYLQRYREWIQRYYRALQEAKP